MEFITLIIGFILLIKAADFFVDASINIAKAFKISEVIIGATIVSIGTTLPETLVSAVSAYKGHGDISYGNALGSIICNTALIAATSCIFAPSIINKITIKLPIIFFFVSLAVYSFFAYTNGGFTRMHGLILISIFIIYVVYTIYSQKQKSEDNVKNDDDNISNTGVNVAKEFLILIVSAAIIAFAANLLVDSATSIARNFGVPESVIGITIVAFGTSLPEFTTAITSIVKGHSNISFGNIVGANLLNLLVVSGVAIVINPFSLPETYEINGINSSLVVDIPLAFVVMVIFTIPPLICGATKRWQGIVLWIIYVAFLIYQVKII